MLMPLIRKDLRICRLPLLIGAAFAIGTFALSYLVYVSADLWQDGNTEAWAWILRTGSSMSLVLKQATPETHFALTFVGDRAHEFAKTGEPFELQRIEFYHRGLLLQHGCGWA